jgi:serine phosphatase RsbU (regulator of sigma subunit)
MEQIELLCKVPLLSGLPVASLKRLASTLLERELQVAAEIQMSILTQELPQVYGFDFGTRMLPARLVGGDFYDVFPLKGGRWES